MRERLAKVRIEAATLAGGEVNQDYYAYGETYALVLDGASSFLPEFCSIDTATYVRSMGEALSRQLENCQLDEIPKSVATAIEEITSRYGLVEESSPSSTAVIAKWNQVEVAIYVLGDSFCVLLDNSNKCLEISDDRMSKFGAKYRELYRSRLRYGYGFDSTHRKILRRLQKEQRKHKNKAGGYWVLGASKQAADEGLVSKFPVRELQSVLLMTDGAMGDSGEIYKILYSQNLRKSLTDIMQMEKGDQLGNKRPRSKVHDDKTVVRIKV